MIGGVSVIMYHSLLDQQSPIPGVFNLGIAVVRSSGRFRSDESGVKYNVDSLIIHVVDEGGGVFGVLFLYMLVRNGEVLLSHNFCLCILHQDFCYFFSFLESNFKNPDQTWQMDGLVFESNFVNENEIKIENI